MTEFKNLVLPMQGKVNAQVRVSLPKGYAPEWSHTDIYDQAQALPGVNVELDEGGLEANRFHAKTSGYALLYAPSGQLLFSGGITQGRGHIGDNPGRRAVAALIEGKNPGLREFPVYGCPLAEDDDESE